jgi:zinc transport system permease protein
MWEWLAPAYMQRAVLALLLLAPATALLGVHVVGLGRAFLAESAGHVAVAAAAATVALALDAIWLAPLVVVAMAILVEVLERRVRLAADTAVGVLAAGLVAAGLALASRHPGSSRLAGAIVFGDVLGIQPADLGRLGVALVAVLLVHVLAFNRLVLAAAVPGVATGLRLPRLLFAIALALTACEAVRVAGALLSTALLVVPAATARLLAGGAGSQAWWALGVALGCAIGGLALATNPLFNLAAGPAVVLLSCGAFAVALPLGWWRNRSLVSHG